MVFPTFPPTAFGATDIINPTVAPGLAGVWGASLDIKGPHLPSLLMTHIPLVRISPKFCINQRPGWKGYQDAQKSKNCSGNLQHQKVGYKYLKLK